MLRCCGDHIPCDCGGARVSRRSMAVGLGTLAAVFPFLRFMAPAEPPVVPQMPITFAPHYRWSDAFAFGYTEVVSKEDGFDAYYGIVS